MKRIFLDANVLFSGCREGSVTADLIDILLHSETLVISSEVKHEVFRNIQAKFPVFEGRMKRLLAAVEQVPDALFDLPIPINDKDRSLVCSAIKAKAHLFVTADRRGFSHLYDTKVYGVHILSVEALARLFC